MLIFVVCALKLECLPFVLEERYEGRKRGREGKGKERGRKEGVGSRREQEGGEGVRGEREEEKEEGREREGFWGGGGMEEG